MGEKINDPYKKDKKTKNMAEKFADGVLTRMQKSRSVLASVVVILMLSLFINYKAITKLAVVVRTNEDTVEPTTVKPTKDKPNLTTVPKEKASTVNETVSFLEDLYGVTK